MIDTAHRLRVLLVDDEPAVLEGLELQLRRRYEVHTATGAAEGLRKLAALAPFAVVMTDMRMPGMDGAAFLAQVRAQSPESVRMLLTGHADTASAMAAINEGAVFRFLTKPCATEPLLAAFDLAARQYRVQMAERELLESTLRGAVKALVEVLGVVDAAGHGEALRVQRLALDLGRATRVDPLWPLEIAALLSVVGAVSLPPETQARVHAGEVLSDDEQKMLARLPQVTDRLLAPIPRLEPVRAILLLRHGLELPEAWNTLFDAAALIRLRHAAAVLRAAAEFDALQTRGFSAAESIGYLRGVTRGHEAAVVDALEALCHAQDQHVEIRRLPVSRLRPGMVIAEDVHLVSGQLLIGRGFEIGEGFLARLANFRRGTIREPIPVILPQAATPAQAVA